MQKRYLIKGMLIVFCILLSSACVRGGDLLLGHWSFDTNENDSSSFGNHGALVGDAKISTNSRIGAGSLYCDGDGDACSITENRSTYGAWPAPLTADNLSREFTFAAWVNKSTNDNTKSTIIGNRAWTGQYCFGYYTFSGFGAGFCIGMLETFPRDPNEPKNSGLIITNNYPSAGEWFFAVATFSLAKSNIALYMNGELRTNAPKTVRAEFFDPYAIGIGALPKDGKIHDPFEGYIDDVSIWSNALDSGTIRGLYNAGAVFGINATEYLGIKAFHDRSILDSYTNINGNYYYFVLTTPNTYSNGQVINSNTLIFNRIAGTGVTVEPFAEVPAPTNFRAVLPVTNQNIILSWDDDIYETSYTLFSSTNNDTSSLSASNIIAGLAMDETGFTVTNYVFDKINYFWVKAYNSYYESSYSAVAFEELPVPDIPSPMTAEQVGDNVIVKCPAVDYTINYLFYTYSLIGVTNLITITTGYYATNIMHMDDVERTNFYMVKASNSRGSSVLASSITLEMFVPDPPVSIDPEIICGIQPTITWPDSPYESGYKFVRKLFGSPDITNRFPMNQTVHYDTNNVLLGSNYTYLISATNKFGYNDFVSNSITIPAINPPDAPAISLSNYLPTKVVIWWTDSTNETSYTLFRSMTNDIDTASPVCSRISNITICTDTRLGSEITYYYWIKAYNLAGAVCEVSNTNVITYPNPDLKIKTIVNHEGDRVILNWDTISIAGFYRVYKSLYPINDASLGSAEELVRTANNTITTYTDRAVGYGQTYFYNVAYYHTGKFRDFLTEPASKFLAMVVDKNDIRTYYELEVTPLVLTREQSNWALNNPLIREPVISAYKAQIYVHGMGDELAAVVEATPPYKHFDNAKNVLLDGITSYTQLSGVSGDAANRNYAWGAQINAGPFTIIDLGITARVTNIRIYKWDYEKKEDNDLATACVSVASVAKNWKEIGCAEFPYVVCPKYSTNVNYINYPIKNIKDRILKYIRIDLISVYEDGDNDWNAPAIVEVEFDMLPPPKTMDKPESLQTTFNLILPYDEDRVLQRNIIADNLGIFVQDGVEWRYVGGTVDESSKIISADTVELGVFAIFPIDKSLLKNKKVYIKRRYLTLNNDGYNDSLNIAFKLDKETEVDVRIMDLSGVIIRKLCDKQMINGHFFLTWNGDDVKGNKIRSGPYIYQIRLDGKLEENGIFLILR